MIDAVKDFLKTGKLGRSSQSEALTGEGDKLHATHELQLAVAVLLVEAAVLADDFSDAEKDTVAAILQSRFDLSTNERESLMELASDTQANAIELHSFTNLVKQEYSAEERVEIVEILWEVAYADSKINEYEEYLVRKVAGLIHVSDRDRGDAAKRVRAKLGIT